MPPTDALLQAFTHMLSELEEYLLSPELFWPLSQRSSALPQDRLTLGNLLLSLDQINAVRQTWDGELEATFQKSFQLWEHSQARWQSAIEHKAGQEISSRMNLWRAYLSDLDEGQGAAFDYSREVRNRVIIERLFDLGLSRDPWEKELQRLDQLNRSLSIPGEFLWTKSLESQYPPNPYWFLYQKPRSNNSR